MTCFAANYHELPPIASNCRQLLGLLFKCAVTEGFSGLYFQRDENNRGGGYLITGIAEINGLPVLFIANKVFIFLLYFLYL